MWSYKHTLYWLADVIVALSQTGTRIGELAALRRADVDFDRNVINITNDQPSPAGARTDR